MINCILSCACGSLLEHPLAEPCMERLLLGLGGAAFSVSGPFWRSTSCYSPSTRAATLRCRRLANWPWRATGLDLALRSPALLPMPLKPRSCALALGRLARAQTALSQWGGGAVSVGPGPFRRTKVFVQGSRGGAGRQRCAPRGPQRRLAGGRPGRQRSVPLAISGGARVPNVAQAYRASLARLLPLWR